MRWSKVWTVARIDLHRLFISKDYWIPMVILGGIFFVFIPWVLLGVVTRPQSINIVQQIGEVLTSLPGAAADVVQGETAQGRAAYSMAVFLLAPVAIVVPLTISSAVGAQAIVGERERGIGEFLAHSPLSIKEIYAGKLIASALPGYVATLVGFTVYALIVNFRAGPVVGGWFFPTAGWWLLIFWVVPPFLLVALAIIVRLSARVQSTAAAQQAASLISLPIIMASYVASSGFVLNPTLAATIVGSVAWVLAIWGIASGARAINRERLLGVGSGN
jgi:ABC-type Na+ efflux pump permease subunit